MANNPKAAEIRAYATERANAMGINPGVPIGLIEELSSYSTGRTGTRLGLMGAPANSVKDVDAFLKDWKGQIDSGLVSLAASKQAAGGTDVGAALAYMGTDPTAPDAKVAQRVLQAYARGSKYTGEALDATAMGEAAKGLGVTAPPERMLRTAGIKEATGASRAQQNLELSQRPEVARYLSMIGKAEGADYNTTFGGASFNDFSRHPNIQKKFTQTDGNVNSSGAAGRYQFIKGTWDDVSGKLGLKDFSPASQDAAAVELLRRSGSLSDVMAGNYQAAVAKDGRTWASLPSSPYAQNKRSANFVQAALGGPVGNAPPASPAPTLQTASQPLSPIPDTYAVEPEQDDGTSAIAEEHYAQQMQDMAQKERASTLDGRINAVFGEEATLADNIGAGVDEFIASIARGV